MATPAPPLPTVQSSAPAPTGLTPSGNLPTLPTGGQYVWVQGDMPNGQATLMVVYDIGNGTKIYYDFSQPGQPVSINLGPAGATSTTMTKQAFYGQPGLIQGGNVAAITSDKWDPSGHTAPKPGQTFQDWIKQQISTYAGGADWVNDPQMLAIYEKWITNPQLTSAEIDGEIRQTTWWQTHTSATANYATLSQADQAQADQNEALKLQNQFFATSGVMMSLQDPQLLKWAHDVASGAVSEADVIGQMQTIALQNPNSPISRSITKEGQDERQRSADISTYSGNLQDLYRQYGFQPNPGTITQQATDIVDNKNTMEGITETLKQQAANMYPGYNQNMTVEQWAQPWTDTYSRLLETDPNNGIFDPLVQEAMTNNTPIWQFEQTLRSQPQWLNTDNAKSTLMSAAGGVAKQMGFE